MRILLWDFDETLAERPGRWSQCLAELANAHVGAQRFRREDFSVHLKSGFPWHFPQQAHTEIRSAEQWWDRLYPLIARAFSQGAGFSAGEAQALAKSARQAYLNPVHWRVFPDVAPSLSLLTGLGWRHAILSNHVPELAQLVDALGLAGHFEAIHTSALLGYEKPHPQAFLSALPPGLGPESAVMVGDNLIADIRGAEELGIKAILVRKPDPQKDGAIIQLAQLVELLNADSQARTIPD